MISLLINLLILFLVLGVVYWIITMIPLPPPFGKIAQVILAVIALVVLVEFLLGGTGFASYHLVR